MIKKIFLAATVLILITTLFFVISTKSNTSSSDQSSIEQQREQLKNHLTNSPFKETLTWDKKKRKLNGLPPNRYFEQLWELTINPSTGKLDDGELTLLREQIIQQRNNSRNPGDATNPWVERGPNNVGGRTRVIMFDPNDALNNTVYAGGVSGGLWINTNIISAASTWTRVENVPGNLSVTSITVDPRNSNIWYIGTGEQYTAGDVVGNGVYVTTDGGTNWNAVNIPPADGGNDINYGANNLFLSGIYNVNDILAWDNGASTELFVAVGANRYGDASSPNNWLGIQSSGIYRSINNGVTWNRIETPNLQYIEQNSGDTYPYIPNDFEVGADNKIWVGTIASAFGQGGGRVFSSTNGSTWTEAAASPLTDSNRVELECSATNANKIYALTQGVNSPVHIYETTNAFGSISSLSLPNDADTDIAANDFCRGQAFYDLVIEADPTNDNIVYVGGIDLFRSTNGGGSWGQISKWSNNNNLAGLNCSFVHADQHAMTFRPGNSNQAIFGTDGGVYYASSLSNAQNTDVIGARNTNYNVTQFVKAGIGPDGNGDVVGIFSAGAQDNGTQAFRDGNTAPGVNSSEELSDGDGFYTFIDKDGEYAIATFINNVIYRFDLPWNGLGRRQGGATTLLNDQFTGDFVNQMDYDSDANRLLTNNSSGGNFSIRSINVAANNNGTFTNNALTDKPTAFRASPFATNTWYVGTADGSLVRLTNVTNSSATFTAIATPFVGSVSSVRFGETANDLIVTMHNYGVTSIWYSSNAGANWVSKEGNLPNIPVRDFLQNPLLPNEAIVATQLGVWQTLDFNVASPSWSQADNGMSDVSVTSFDYWDVSGDDTTNQVIASTYGRGVFTGSFSAIVPDSEAPTAPTNLAVSNITGNSVDLNWDAATDNVGVTEYDIYQDGILIDTAPSTTYQVTGLTPLTSYDFYVIARDAAGNSSPQSNIVTATTIAPDTEDPTTPLNLLASNVTNASVDLNWEASIDNYGSVSYDIYQDDVFVINVLTTMHQITSLSGDTVYSFKVRAKDSAGNESEESNEVAILTLLSDLNYCVSESTITDDEFISRVQLNTIDNISGPTFYSDFTNISTTLRKGTQYTISITPTWPTPTIYDEGYGVWIDYNNDGDFVDAGEEVFTNAPSQDTPVIGSFTIPQTATESDLRMRVTLRYDEIPGPCDEFTWGEVEDYTVKIIGSGDLIYTNNTWIPYAPSPTTGADNALVLDGTYNLTGNIQLNNIRVYDGANMIIEKAQSLTLNGDLISKDNVVLESDSNEYASLIVTNNVVGNVKYQRYVNTTIAGNDLIAPPVFGEPFDDFRNNNPNILSNTANTSFLFGPFDKITDTYLLYSDTETAPMYAGIGYRAASTDASTFTFTGLVTTRNVTVPVVISGPTNPEWNLIGNPYPSYIYLADFLSANNSKLDTQRSGIYGYDGNASDGWTIWNQAYSDANPNAKITPGQGFLIASATSLEQINFTAAMRTTGSDDDFILGRQDNSVPISHLKLKLDNTSNSYNTDFYFTENASLGLDPNYDSGLFGGAPSLAIYSQLVEDNIGRNYGLQSIGSSNLSNVTIPLGVNISEGQQATISITETTLPDNVEVYLEDNLTNTFTLLNTSDYVFTANTNLTGTGRFFLSFAESTLSVNTNDSNSIEIFTSKEPKTIFVKGQLFEDTALTVYDIQGRVVKTMTLNSSQTLNRIDVSSVSKGVYMVSLKNGQQEKIGKVVVK